MYIILKTDWDEINETKTDFSKSFLPFLQMGQNYTWRHHWISFTPMINLHSHPKFPAFSFLLLFFLSLSQWKARDERQLFSSHAPTLSPTHTKYFYSNMLMVFLGLNSCFCLWTFITHFQIGDSTFFSFSTRFVQEILLRNHQMFILLYQYSKRLAKLEKKVCFFKFLRVIRKTLKLF